MGVNYQYQCSHCKVKFKYSGPWAFYRNKKGERIPYGYPGPLTEEARLSGIQGFFADMLCLNCGREVNVILEEYNKKVEGFFAAMRRLWKGEEEGVKCPSCKSKELFLNEESDHPGGIVCPLCKEGTLALLESWTP